MPVPNSGGRWPCRRPFGFLAIACIRDSASSRPRRGYISSVDRRHRSWSMMQQRQRTPRPHRMRPWQRTEAGMARNEFSFGGCPRLPSLGMASAIPSLTRRRMCQRKKVFMNRSYYSYVAARHNQNLPLLVRDKILTIFWASIIKPSTSSLTRYFYCHRPSWPHRRSMSRLAVS